ncbi:MAG: MBL fold metallo-hydrolase [Chloroflexi bacterium]|nr:MBL fold metallo-hydrolase [Chloroflexota bacterium]
MFEIVFLGTSAAAPSIHRGLPAQIVIAREHRFLVDCGEGTQRQILKSGIGFRKLNRVLLTHAHLDHILGLGGLISTFVNWEEGIEFLEIYGGYHTLQRVSDLVFGVAIRGIDPPMPIKLIQLKANSIVFEDKHMTVTAFPVVHRGSGNFGFIFQQKAHRPFLEAQAQELGVPAGPERAVLVKGEAVTLEDGRRIEPDDVLGESLPGAKLVIIGDLAETRDLGKYVQDADCLVMEATYLDEEADVARAVGHITAGEAARFAHAHGVKSLILTHVSRRNSERDVRHEVETFFPNAFVARDFDHFTITRGQPARKHSPSPPQK